MFTLWTVPLSSTHDLSYRISWGMIWIICRNCYIYRRFTRRDPDKIIELFSNILNSLLSPLTYDGPPAVCFVINTNVTWPQEGADDHLFSLDFNTFNIFNIVNTILFCLK